MRMNLWNTNDWVNHFETQMKENPYMNEQEAYSDSWEWNMKRFEAIKSRLENVRGTDWFAVGKIVRWNGSSMAYRALMPGSVMDAVCETMRSFHGADNSFEIYIENGDVFISQMGHDNPTSPSVVRIRQVTDEAMEREHGDPEDVMYMAINGKIDMETNTLGFGKLILDALASEQEVEA